MSSFLSHLNSSVNRPMHAVIRHVGNVKFHAEVGLMHGCPCTNIWNFEVIPKFFIFCNSILGGKNSDRIGIFLWNDNFACFEYWKSHCIEELIWSCYWKSFSFCGQNCNLWESWGTKSWEWKVQALNLIIVMSIHFTLNSAVICFNTLFSYISSRLGFHSVMLLLWAWLRWGVPTHSGWILSGMAAEASSLSSTHWRWRCPSLLGLHKWISVLF